MPRVKSLDFFTRLRSALSKTLSSRPPAQRSLERIGSAYYDVGPACQIENVGGLLEKYLGARDQGFFVEVGAFDGISHSNTIGLVRRGWSGIAVEPDPSSAGLCRQTYRAFPNMRVEEVAIGRLPQAEVTLMQAGTLSSISNDMIGLYQNHEWAKDSLTGRSVQVESTSLDALLELHAPPKIDLLVVDVEGAEEDVFGGFSLEKWRPVVVIVELTENHPDFIGFRSTDCAIYEFLLNSRYVVAYKDSINTVFVDATRYRSSNSRTMIWRL